MRNIEQELSNYLVSIGATFNAENPDEPIVLRPARLNVIVTSVVDYLIGAGYASEAKILQD